MGTTQPCLAQITADGSVGTQVTPLTSGSYPGGIFYIDAGQTAGNNLFHSFDTFSVPTNGLAFFEHDPTIENIITRVTGTSLSFIDGIIATRGSANLFLLNPNGITFGPNAQLALDGSFFTTTADSWEFENGFSFSSSNAQTPPLLTINTPIGLQFGIQAEPIINQAGSLGGSGLIIDDPNINLAMVGGGIAFEGGQAYLADSRLSLGSVMPSSFVGLQDTANGWQLNYDNASGFNDITLSQEAVVSSFGSLQTQARRLSIQEGSTLRTIAGGADPAGAMEINVTEQIDILGASPSGLTPSRILTATLSTGAGEDLSINTGTLNVANGGEISTLSIGTASAGTVRIHADTVSVMGVSTSGARSSIVSSVQGSATGRGGDVDISASTLTVSGGAVLGSVTGAAGNSGNTIIRANQINLSGVSPAGSVSTITVGVSSGATGQGGLLQLQTDCLSLAAGAQISASTFGAGDAGDIDITARDIELQGDAGTFLSGIYADVQPGGSGNGGNITINTQRLRSLDGARITASALSTVGSGNAGDILIRANDALFQGIDSTGLRPSGILTVVNSNVTGNGGDINLISDNLKVLSGAQLTASTGGFGEAGNIMVNTTDLEVAGRSVNNFFSSQIASTVRTNGLGNGGNLLINANRLRVAGSAQINASTFGVGNAGDLTINAQSIDVEGTVNVGAATVSSALVASVEPGAIGNGGQLTVNTDALRIQSGATVTVSAVGNGEAGNVSINANSVYLNQEGSIEANVSSGQQGNIGINANLILLRRGSQISTNATGTASGGNITLNSPILAGFENSDIIANAVFGTGGQINITTQGIFGLAFRDQLTPENDITASSEFGISGTVDINNFGVDPGTSLVELPEGLADGSDQVAQGCASGDGNEFIATGRGGLPTDPTISVGQEQTWADTRIFSPSSTVSTAPAGHAPMTTSLTEATTWQTNATGQIELVAVNTAQPAVNAHVTCASSTAV
ncbi:MAG: S-layer family protein [Cyanobacteria bacterium J06632_22]